MTEIDVSIIIVNYNTTGIIINSIKSVFKHARAKRSEVIVVDNNSTVDPTPQLEKEFQKRVIIIRLECNIGFGRANNEGIKVARGEYVFLLNPDTLLVNDAVISYMQYPHILQMSLLGVFHNWNYIQ